MTESKSELKRKALQDDCISRKAAIDALKKKIDKSAKGEIGSFYNTIILSNIETLILLPSAQPDMSEYSDKLWKAAYERGKREAQPMRKKGQWVPIDDFPHEVWKCDCCGHIYEYEDDPDELPNFCPNCGADMREPE